MNALWWQYAVVGTLVAGSALYMLRRLAPALARRCQARIAAWLSRSRSARWQALGQRLLPASVGGGCGGGACDGCASGGDAPAPLEQKMTFHRRR